jgi:alpha-1,2-mannosyltransferase
VLWTAIAATQLAHPNCVSLVYTGDVDATKEQIIAQVKARFAISLDPKSLHFVYLRKRYLVEDATWPRFTLLGQSLGSMVLAWEALAQVIPDLYIGVLASFRCWMTDPHAAQTAWATLSHSMSSRGSLRAL